MRPNFAKIEWSDLVEFVDSNLTEYARPNFAKFNSSDFVEFVDSNLTEYAHPNFAKFNSTRSAAKHMSAVSRSGQSEAHAAKFVLICLHMVEKRNNCKHCGECL